MKKIINLELTIEKLEKYSYFINSIDNHVSQKGTYWHIEHSLSVINRAFHLLLASNPDEYKREHNLTRMYIFMRSSFPRGKVQAPSEVIPQDEITFNDLKDEFVNVKLLLKELHLLPQYSHFQHPQLGILDLKMSIKFLYIHTVHHMKIITDILGHVEDVDTLSDF